MVNITYDASGTITATDANGIVSVYNNGDFTWTLTCTALVWLMIPDLGYMYSRLLRRKNALSQIYLNLVCLTVVSFQWLFWGYSLAFSETRDSGGISGIQCVSPWMCIRRIPSY
ncbi:uncharacterized protein EV420DRAFT_1119769 [Desarmillaria tabescens]|uniref:Ammonium transporter AmtB-like domain-containing protein n=1 Tax=Armillaria tabescens TaxID=1929756 RepID=A0AA39JGR8_ARMTA|nr:uncharacterized protein EV420DRAFT_1119769 [Desarmillaria tabescens]KAK0441461.1 hypothetical protein EV420DRAFT_1119769 [Desarmillaria tabescens]